MIKKNRIKKRSVFIAMVLCAVFTSATVLAEGFTKLQDKFGTPTSTPVQAKELSSTSQDNDTTTTNSTSEQAVPEGMIMLNGVDVDIKDMIKLISNTTGRNFILKDTVKGKITIISEKPMTYQMAYEAFLSALEVNGFTVVETPAGLLNIIPKKDSITKPTDLFKDESPNTDKFITRIIQVNNISANDVFNVIKPMISKDGNSFAYPTTNSVIITDSGSNIDHILKLIKELDQEGPQEVLDIIPIINADAKDIAGKVNEIFSEDKEGADAANKRRQVFRRGQDNTAMDDVQQISKIISDERTNSVIVLGTKRSILKIRNLISKLDRNITGIEGTIHVYYLSHANAKELAEVLNNLVSGSSSSASKTSAAGKPGAPTTNRTGAASSVELEGGVKVTADEGTNSLVITASPKDFTTLVDKVISKLDIVRPQVYLEAVIMSLDVTKSTSLGISGNAGGIFNTLSGGGTMTGFGSLLPASTSAISSMASAVGGLGAGVVSSDTTSFTLADGSTVSIPAISGIIQALQSDTDVNVLSTPSVLTLDNEEASIQVGKNVPVPSGTTVSSGVTTFNVTREDVGIILKITPQISESDTVKLKIEQEISSVSANDPSLGPTLEKKQVKTSIVAKDKQTIVIGGLIDDQNLVATQKVPLLGDIPVLGNLFRNRQVSKAKSNLIVFLTPYIIKERNDYLAILKKKIEERNAFIDMNYGTGQKKQIRQAIHNHAMDLLEFKCDPSDLNVPCAKLPESNFNPNAVTEKTLKNEYNPTAH